MVVWAERDAAQRRIRKAESVAVANRVGMENLVETQWKPSGLKA